ncbi:MAG: FecR domain-containing protein [Hyphomicrobiales bacterium]
MVVVTTDGQQIGAARNLLLCPGDEVRTGVTGRVTIRFDQKRTVVRLDGNSRTQILSGGTGQADVSLTSGMLYFLSSVRQKFRVDTPYIVAGIEGTEALVAVQPNQALAITSVREGIVKAYDTLRGPSHAEKVKPGEAAFRSSSVPFQVAPLDAVPAQFRGLLIVSDSAVDWAIYYPPILTVKDTHSAAVRDAIVLLTSGDYDRAAKRLDGAGKANVAATAALRTIIAVSRNRLEEAKRMSNIALRAGPSFAPGYIAASYVDQAEGNLGEALDFAREAAAIAPEDAYVLARLAELLMIIGDRPRALETAEASLAIRRTSLALFVIGIARLAAWQYDRAEDAFRAGIALDPQSPLPRLGLGLAFIKRAIHPQEHGKLSEPLRMIQTSGPQKLAGTRVLPGKVYLEGD